MSTELPHQIATLFERYPTLWGFSVRGIDDIPDSCPRSGDRCELFLGDVGLSPGSAEQYCEIYEELLAALSEMLSEESEACERLRGRTFARAVH
jgi:hypothetical protein